LATVEKQHNNLKKAAKKVFILLEDLGDKTLLRELQNVSNQTVELEIYERVIDELISMHLNASPKSGSSDKVCAFDLHFNHTKLMWEVDFCIEHFYKTYLSRQIKDKDFEILRGRFSEICTFLSNEPEVFTHRDFHSRNVMVAGEGFKKRFVMIDFQDARMGPAAYDLSSLLRDSYYQLSEVQVSRLVDYYMTRRSALEGVRIKPADFQRSFDLMSVQRNFKAIGSFASFLNRRGNPGYLKYIGNTFENIRRTLLKYPEYADLREVLFHYYYF
jgi:aminoglycoside/choline kinase family phosphotransferase